MSEYRDFISDFPTRCASLLRRYQRDAEHHGREVTLMLCVAASAIAIPLERLKAPFQKDGKANAGHPSRDWERYGVAKEALDRLLDEPFIGSALWPVTADVSWYMDELATTTGSPDDWSELRKAKPLGVGRKTRGILTHIRNALAHGNVYTRGGGQIHQIVLLSSVCYGSDKFNYLMTTPADFRALLLNWIEFLKGLKLPADVVSETSETEAA